MRHASVAALALALCWPCLGCDLELAGSSTATLTYTEDARRAYQEALGAFRQKDWEDAKALFEEVQERFPQSRYARLAGLRLADIAFAQEKYTDAIASYRTFISQHRTNDEVEYARYRMAKALYLDIEDTILLPTAEERDQATIKEAHRELLSFSRKYPTSRYAPAVDYMLEVVTSRLVRHELYVARYYLREDVFEATIARVDYAMREYPNSGMEPEALVLKGETLMKMNRRKEAKAVFQTVIDDFGGPFATTARAFLEEIRNPTQAPASIVRPPEPDPAPAAAKSSAPTPASAKPPPAKVEPTAP